MERVLFFWQKLHYNIYKFNCFTQLYVFGFPVTLLLKNRYIIKQYEKKGIKDISGIITRTLTNPQTSTVNWITDGSMILLIGLIVFSMLNFITAIVGYMIWADWSFLIYLILIGVPSVSINYFALWKQDQYLTYFKQFEKEPKAVKRKWAWISIGTVLGILVLLISSFVVMIKGIH